MFNTPVSPLHLEPSMLAKTDPGPTLPTPPPYPHTLTRTPNAPPPPPAPGEKKIILASERGREWAVLFGLDVVLLLLVRVGVAPFGVDDGRVRVRRVVRSFGFVREVGTWGGGGGGGGGDEGQCHGLDNSLLPLGGYKRLKCRPASHSASSCKSLSMWPFPHQTCRAVIFWLYVILPPLCLPKTSTWTPAVEKWPRRVGADPRLTISN